MNLVSDSSRTLHHRVSPLKRTLTRRTAQYLLLLALSISLFYWKTLLTDQFTAMVGSEGVNLTYSWLHFWVQSIWRGHIPLWDPYAFAGRPFAGEMLPSAFYPLQLLFALAPLNRNGLISPRLYHEVLVLTHVLCAWFMFALLRELKRSRFASFVGACAFSLGGLLARMMWPPYIEGCIWLPAIFLFLLRALRAERRDRALLEAGLGGLCLGMSILTGAMAFSMMQGIFAVTAVIYYGASGVSLMPLDRRSHWIRPAVVIVVFVVVACGTGAVQLLPAAEYGQQAMRFIDGGIFPAARKIPYDRLVPGMFPQSIVAGLIPAAFGGKLGGEEDFPYYIGVLPLFFAVIAVWKCWNHVWVRYLAVLAVLAFVYSLGEFSPLNGVLYAVVPYLWAARSANRFLYLVSFALAVLAAFGLDELLEGTSENTSWIPARRILKWVGIACTGALFLPGIFTQLVLNQWVAFSLLLILASCGGFAHLTLHPAGPWVRGALAAFILFDLAAFNWVEGDKALKAGDELAQMISLRGPAQFVKSQPGLNRVRVSVDPQPNVGDVYGIQNIWGGGATALTEYSRLGFRDNLMNVRYYIKPVSTPEPNPVYRDEKWKVFENPRAFPRAWFVHQTVVESSLDSVYRRLDDPRIDLRTTAILDKPLPPSVVDDEAGAGGSVSFLSYEPDRISLDVNTGKAGLLVLSEMYYPGWRARVNGKQTDILRVDGALRGILTPGGANRIELEYAPRTFYTGAIVSLLTVMCVLAGLISGWRRNRERLRSSSPVISK